ncbi:ABC transporter permease [Phytoactinopolyspora halotolerans]|uniref:ABC transporter permease n=1 Tax=Phytoactinopolyspora halotolerans TaxID=1981512 RepID=A0A6L9S2N2_9ACTN|nr:ABC transporter permease [Phytoactinopolyspora halotolerans]NED98801.1 ABC transporter permease [Phytoactinopolyspora halotolerans]
MLRTTVRQMRAHLGRLIAAGVAITIASAFVTATLLSTGVIERTVHNAVLTAYGGADVIVDGPDIPADALDDVRSIPEVAGADGRVMAPVTLRTGARSDYQAAAPIPGTPELQIELSDGAFPDQPGEIVVSEPTAKRLDLDVGSSVQVGFDSWTPDGGWAEESTTVTVSGISVDPGAAFDSDIPGVLADVADVRDWSTPGDDGMTYEKLMVVGDANVSDAELVERVRPALDQVNAEVLTADEYAREVTAEFTSGTYLLSAVLAGFGAVALFAAGMVISNTFAVLVAQRTRNLALLRCVGATRRQVHRGVLAEATLTGAVASLLGLGAGLGLAQAAVAVLNQVSGASWLPDSVPVPLIAVVVPLVTGTGVTVLAALSPARAATRVAPLAALRPLLPPAFRSKASRRRIAITTALLLTGGALLALGTVMASGGASVGLALATGMLGGAVSFLGVVVGAVVIVPPAVAALGRLFARVGGVPARMAAANSVRHPRRTASTAAALLIGVTLVAMMSVGAASTQATLDDELDQRYAVDISVGQEPVWPGMGELRAEPELSRAAAEAAGGISGVTGMVALHGVRATVAPVGAGETAETAGTDVSVHGLDPDAARRVVRSESSLSELASGTAVVPTSIADDLRVSTGDTITVSSGDTRGSGGTAGTDGTGGSSIELDVAVAPVPDSAVLVTEQDLWALDTQPPLTRVWLGLSETADPGVVIRDVQDAVSLAVGSDQSVPVDGAAAERAEISDVLDTMLAVVTGLLAVAVLIALIGVSNTLSLSVIERTRESATMRALGLTRRQLRSMLALEGVLVALAGAILGIGLGLVYGWLGTATTLGAVWETQLTVPWARLAAIVVIAILAGLVASALPGRRAAKAAPVAALAAE